MNRHTMREVYFLKPVGMDGPIKIGCSKWPENQLGVYGSWSPFPLEIIVAIPGSIDLEKNIHECFVDCHSHAEWFHASPRLVAAIEALTAGIPVGDAIDLNDRKGNIHAAKLRRSRSLNGTSQKASWR